MHQLAHMASLLCGGKIGLLAHLPKNKKEAPKPLKLVTFINQQFTKSVQRLI